MSLEQPQLGAAAPLYTEEVFSKHNSVLTVSKLSLVGFNPLPALVLGRKEEMNVCAQSTWSRELCVAFLPCQEARGLVLLCVATGMSTQSQLQTNFPAGFNLPLGTSLLLARTPPVQLQEQGQGCRRSSRALLTSCLEQDGGGDREDTASASGREQQHTAGGKQTHRLPSVGS